MSKALQFKSLLIHNVMMPGLLGIGLIFHLCRVAQAAPGDSIADAVLGQTNLTSNSSGASATKLFTPGGVAVDRHSGRLYVSDTNNSRILSWPSAAAFSNGAAADLVIGQANFTSGAINRGGSAGANTLFAQRKIAVDENGNLYVADVANQRVLEFDSPAATDTIADRVFCQPDFVTVAPGTTNASCNGPSDVALDASGRLFVVEETNNRVIAFDAPLDSDSIADKVWGQPDFVSTGSGTSASAFAAPVGIAFDNLDNLYVSELNNSRVLEFDGGFGGDTVADRVFGQPNFTTGTAGLSDSKLDHPNAIDIDLNGNLYVADSFNNRIMVFNSPALVAPNSSGGAANRVIGQSDFTTKTSGVSASTLFTPNGLTLDGLGNLYATDRNNSRLLRYDGVTIDAAPATQFTSNESVFIKKFGAGSPFPSSLNVAGITGTVSKVSVSLKHLSHTNPDDLDIFLVGPTGKAAILMSDNGGSADIDHLHLTFEDAAIGSLPGSAPLTSSSSTIKPSNDDSEGADSSTVLAGLGTLLSVFNGENPNGEWKLYIIDDSNNVNQGGLGGWGLNIFITPEIDRFVVAPTTANVGDTITYSARIDRAPGDSVSYSWDFGDGTSAIGATVTHVYSTPGTFVATVTGTATGGGVVTQSTSVTINAPTDLKPISLKTKLIKGKLQCTFNVQNTGTTSAGATTAQLRFGLAADSLGKIVKSFAVPALTAGAISSTFTFTKAPGKNKYCRVVVDSENAITETDEGNNSISKRGKR